MSVLPPWPPLLFPKPDAHVCWGLEEGECARMQGASGTALPCRRCASPPGSQLQPGPKVRTLGFPEHLFAEAIYCMLTSAQLVQSLPSWSCPCLLPLLLWKCPCPPSSEWDILALQGF